MRMYDCISLKKSGKSLSSETIQEIISGYTQGRIPDYQMSAFLMAVCFRGMDERETLDLTMAMRDSGDVLDLSGIRGIKVDKHSTGGVGDKTTLVLAPMIAALGLRVAKMSGRGLGHTGGTIDKLESFPGFQTAIATADFQRQVNEIGIAVAAQTANLAPADKKLYALRDTTATVDNVSLIASSIMSKKLAAGSDVIVLDVKVGDGAFMKTVDEARRLAETMVNIGVRSGKKVAAVLTGMEEPLGYSVGNQLEVMEAMEALQGKGREDFMSVVYALGAQMLLLGGLYDHREAAVSAMKKTITDGTAFQTFLSFIRAQGGDISYAKDPSRFPKASCILPVYSEKKGCVAAICASEVGLISMALGGGRLTKDSPIDLTVGVILNKKTGDRVMPGEPLGWIHGNDEKKAAEGVRHLRAAYTITDEKTAPSEMILGYVLP